MLEFLSRHPYIVIFLIYALVRIFSPKKKQTREELMKSQQLQRERAEALKALRGEDPRQKAWDRPPQEIDSQAEDRQQAWTRPAGDARGQAEERQQAWVRPSGDQQAPQEPTPQRRPASLEERLAEALRRYEDRAGGAGTTSRAPARTSLPVRTQPEPAAPAAGDAFAFRSLMKPPIPRRDFDSDPNAFGYKPAIRESEDQAFHLKNFGGFRQATAMGASERRHPAGEDVYVAGKDFDAIQDVIGGIESIRRAIIINEILGKPRAFRRYGS